MTIKNYKTGRDWHKFDVQRFPGRIDKIREYYDNYNNKIPLINKKTNIGSMGSCFASSVAEFFKDNGYNYITMEDKMSQQRLSPADWGAVYNPPCIRQIFQYSFEDFNPVVRWWPMAQQENWVIEPFRRDISYHDRDKDKHFENHRKNSQKVLKKAEVMILTLGIAEIWRDKRDKSTFWRVVPTHLYDPKIHEFHIMTVDEVLKELNTVKEIVNKYNPDCKLIITISPVPFFATFRKDIDPISANANSKSILRTAADIFVRNHENVYYFPAYEYIIYANENPWRHPDGRHVRPGVVNRAMRLFHRMFIK